MKKTNSVLSLVLAFCMIVSLGVVNASAVKKADKVGKYVAYELVIDGEKYSYDDIQEVYPNDAMLIELKKDGTATIVLDGEEFDCKWDDKYLYVEDDDEEDEKVTYSVDDDLFKMDIEGDTYTYVNTDSDTYKKLSKTSAKTESSKEESSKEETSNSGKKSDKKTDSKSLPDSDSSVHDEVTVEKTELYNENDVVITLNKIKYDDDQSYGRYELSYTIQNNSDKKINVSSDLFSVNGIMCDDGYIYGSVDAGKKLNDKCSLYFSDLEDINIGTIADIGVRVNVYDDDNYDLIGKSDVLSIKTSADGTFNQKVDGDGITVYDANDVKVICKEVVSDDYYEAGVFKFYIENNSDKNIALYASYDKSYINDTQADVSFYPEVAAGCKMYYDAPVSTSLEDLDIKSYKDIEKLEMELNLEDVDSDSYDYLDTSDVQVSFK